MRRLLMIVAIGTVLYGISQSPGQWADTVEAIGGKLSEIASGFGTFLSRIFS
jgi:hypothetical protein